MEIRRLQENDYLFLASAIERLVSDKPFTTDEVYLKRILADKNHYFILCLDGSMPVGYLSAFCFPSVETVNFQAYLYDITVDEKFRRKEIGTRMIEELKQYCREDKVDYIWVGTTLDNEAAQRTFEAAGAREISEIYVEYEYDFDL